MFLTIFLNDLFSLYPLFWGAFWYHLIRDLFPLLFFITTGHVSNDSPFLRALILIKISDANLSFVVVNGTTDVEDFAFILRISVESVRFVGAVESLVDTSK